MRLSIQYNTIQYDKVNPLASDAGFVAVALSDRGFRDDDALETLSLLVEEKDDESDDDKHGHAGHADDDAVDSFQVLL